MQGWIRCLLGSPQACLVQMSCCSQMWMGMHRKLGKGSLCQEWCQLHWGWQWPCLGQNQPWLGMWPPHRQPQASHHLDLGLQLCWSQPGVRETGSGKVTQVRRQG